MEAVLNSLVSAVSVVIVGAYVWSVRGHFASETMPAGARIIAAVVMANTALLLYLTWFAVQPTAAQTAGLVIQLASGGLFVAAVMASRRAQLKFVFDHENPGSIVDTGPYAYVRHPFYVSYAIFWAGWTIAVWTPVAVVTLIILFGLYIWAARLEEQSFSASPLASDYAAYKARTGFFWPRLG